MGKKRALELTLSCRPIGTRAAREIGFLDDAFGEDTAAFEAELRDRARRLARDLEFRLMLRQKHERRLDDENSKPLASCRAEELAWMRANFFGPDTAYHEARRRFVFKGESPQQRSRTPIRTVVEATSGVLSRGAARAGIIADGLATWERPPACMAVDPRSAPPNQGMRSSRDCCSLWRMGHSSDAARQIWL